MSAPSMRLGRLQPPTPVRHMPPSTRLHRHSSLRLLALLAFATVTLHAVNAPLVTAVAAAPHYTFLFVRGVWGGGWPFAKVDRLLTADPGKKPEEDLSSASTSARKPMAGQRSS